MKPTGNQSVATWLWRPACCLLQCCIRESKKDFSELLAPASVCRVTECATQPCRNIKPYGKRGDIFFYYYISASTLSACPPRLSSPWLLSLHSPHQHNGRISIFRKQTPLEDFHQTLARRYEHPRSHKKKHTPTWYQTHYFSYSQPQTKHTHTHTIPKTNTHQLYCIVTVRGRGRGKLEGTAAACTIQLNLRITVFELAATGATQKDTTSAFKPLFSPLRYLEKEREKYSCAEVLT